MSDWKMKVCNSRGEVIRYTSDSTKINDEIKANIVIKAEAVAKQKAKICQHCTRYTEQLCANCSWRVCLQHSWTDHTGRELCWTCRDEALKVKT